jgi:uncharacterized protein
MNSDAVIKPANKPHQSEVNAGDQYSLAGILGIWLAATLPMALLSWVVFPLVGSYFGSDPFQSAITRIVLLTIGLIWLFVLSMIIVRREEGNLRWATIKKRLRLNTPRDPKTGATRRKLFLWVLPALLGIVLMDVVFGSWIDDLWVTIFPFFTQPSGYDFNAMFESQSILQQLVGAWWFLALFVVFAVFNTMLGEEFLFRGVMLPKMEGVFGKWSWVANGLLFGFYHLHQPWSIPSTIIGSALFFALPAWRFRSTWMSIIVHSAQSFYFAFLILGVVLGLA